MALSDSLYEAAVQLAQDLERYAQDPFEYSAGTIAIVQDLILRLHATAWWVGRHPRDERTLEQFLALAEACKDELLRCEGSPGIQSYTLRGQEPVPAQLTQWARSLENGVENGNNPRLQDTVGESRISTVFLGLATNCAGPPLLFETLVLGGPLDGQCDRYATWEEAQVGHQRMLEQVKRRQERSRG